MKMQEVFERVVHQAEQRRAAHERTLAEQRQPEGMRALLLRLASRRFGHLPDYVMRRIENANMDALRDDAEKLVVAARIEDVFREE